MSVVPLRGIIISSQAKLQRKQWWNRARDLRSKRGNNIYFFFFFYLTSAYVMIRIHNRIKGSNNCVETFNYRFIRGSWYSLVNNLTSCCLVFLEMCLNVLKASNFSLVSGLYVKRACPSLNKTDQTLSFLCFDLS